MKRTRRRAGLFVAVLGVVTLLSALSVGLSGYLAAAATAGTRAGLAALAGADGAFRITIPLASDAAAQDARVRAAVRATVSADGRPVPVIVTRNVVTLDAAQLLDPAGEPVRVALAVVPGLRDDATLVAGSWPDSAAGVSIQADAAARLGVTAGERLTLPGGAPVTVTGTWRVTDVQDPRWVGESIALSGVADNDVPGWLVIDPTLLQAVLPAAHDDHVDFSARWTVRPDAARVTASQLAALQRGPDVVPDALLTEGEDGREIQQTGLLDDGLRPIVQNVASASAAATAPLVVVAVLGLVMLLELARMLEQLRHDENALLRARGASRRRFALSAAAETATAALPGAALGAGIAAALLAPRGAVGDVPVLGWVGAAVIALAAVVVVAAAAGHSSRDVSRGSPMRGSGGAVGIGGLGVLGALAGGRLRSTLEVGAVGLLVLAAVVAVSQFVLYGSPLAPTAAGGVAIDPLAVSAPALAIAAIGLLALAAFPLVARGLEGVARRRPGLGALPVRQLARRSRSALTPILVMAFAVSGLVVGATYSGTWEVSLAQTRSVQVGTSLRVQAPGVLDGSMVRGVSGQTAAAPGVSTEIQIGDSAVTLIELPSADLTRVVTAVPGAVDPATMGRQLRDAVRRPVVPAAASGVTVDIAATPALAVPTAVEVTVVDAAGAQSVLRAAAPAAASDPASGPGSPSATASTSATFTAALPHGLAPFTVHAVSVVLPPVPIGARFSFTLHASGGSTAALPLDDSWVPVRSSDQNGTLVPLGASSDGAVGLRAAQPSEGARVLFQSAPGGQVRLPVILSRGVAHDEGLRVGSVAAMTLVTGGGQLPVTVVGISPVIPGSTDGEGALVDLAGIQDATFRDDLTPISADEWWVATTRPETAAAQVIARAPLGTVAQTPAPPVADEVLESARVAVWIAGAATALLALLAVAAGLLAELRARREEVDVLRALGVGPDPQARARVTEWGALLGLGVLVGVVDGFLVCGILVPGLARMAVPDAIAALRTTFQLDVPGALIELVLLLLALGSLLLVVAASVRRQARTSLAAESGIANGGDAR